MNRRDFLRATGISAAGLAVGCASSASKSGSRIVPPNPPDQNWDINISWSQRDAGSEKHNMVVNAVGPNGPPFHVIDAQTPTDRGGATEILNFQSEIRYTSPKNFAGRDRFKYTLRDRTGWTTDGWVNVNVGPRRLDIRAFVHGFSILHIRKDTFWWLHNLDSGGVNGPPEQTVINGIEVPHPQFDIKPGEKIVRSHDYQIVRPELPSEPHTVRVTTTQKLPDGSNRIKPTQPTAANGYITTLDFDYRDQPRRMWAELTLEFDYTSMAT